MRSAAPRAWASRSWKRPSVPRQANPEHRLHQKAAQAVLKALLPETGTDIKGQMRSRQELLEASGYAEPPQGLRRPDPHPRPRASADHAHRPGRFPSEDQHDHTERAILPTDPRLPRPLPAGLADPQAAGDPARTGGTAAGGTVVARGTPSPRTATCRPPWSGRTSGC